MPRTPEPILPDDEDALVLIWASLGMLGILSSLPAEADYDAKETARQAWDHGQAMLTEMKRRRAERDGRVN